MGAAYSYIVGDGLFSRNKTTSSSSELKRRATEPLPADKEAKIQKTFEVQDEEESDGDEEESGYDEEEADESDMEEAVNDQEEEDGEEKEDEGEEVTNVSPKTQEVVIVTNEKVTVIRVKTEVVDKNEDAVAQEKEAVTQPEKASDLNGNSAKTTTTSVEPEQNEVLASSEITINAV